MLPLLVAGLLLSCDMLKEEEDALKPPSVSVPQASNLSSFTGTPSSDKETNLVLLENVMTQVSNNVENSGVTASRISSKKSKSFSEEIVNETFNNQQIVPGITANGKVYAVMSGTMDVESETYEPAPGDYMEIKANFNIEATIQNYSVQNVDVNGSYYTFTLNGKLDNEMDLTYRMTLENNGLKLSYSIAYGFGYGLSVSNNDPNGPAGKFILTVAYAKSDSAIISQENLETYDYEGFFYPSANEITGGKLSIYNNAGSLVSQYTLTVEELARIIPSVFFPAQFFQPPEGI